MRALPLILALALTACGGGQQASETPAVATVVTVSLPDEPASPWTGRGAALIEQNCLACHSSEMIANQPPLGADKWQATIDKMRTVYAAQISKTDDAALIAALMATQAEHPHAE